MENTLAILIWNFQTKISISCQCFFSRMQILNINVWLLANNVNLLASHPINAKYLTFMSKYVNKNKMTTFIKAHKIRLLDKWTSTYKGYQHHIQDCLKVSFKFMCVLSFTRNRHAKIEIDSNIYKQFLRAIRYGHAKGPNLNIDKLRFWWLKFNTFKVKLKSRLRFISSLVNFFPITKMIE